jgi:NADP-dependent 3-hydroxy acid dehydrogenase YdfG
MDKNMENNIKGKVSSNYGASSDTAVEQFGRIDVILNNAGIMPLSLMERLNFDEWDKMIDVNIKGVLNGITSVLPYMKEQKSGQIINTSSVTGHKIFSGTKIMWERLALVRTVFARVVAFAISQPEDVDIKWNHLPSNFPGNVE